jgi:hypothetical protein
LLYGTRLPTLSNPFEKVRIKKRQQGGDDFLTVAVEFDPIE